MSIERDNVLKVLLVVSDTSEHTNITEMLTSFHEHDFKFEWAQTDEQVQSHIHTTRFDTCIIKHGEVDNSGIKLISRIRDKDISVPIIVISDVENKECDHEAMEAGASDFIPSSECTRTRLERSVRYSYCRSESSLEKAQLLARISNHEKIMSLGGLAIGMAHEINNPLAGALQSCQNIVRRLDPERPINNSIAQECGTTIEQIRMYFSKRGIFDFIDRMRISGERISDVVSSILKFWSNGNSEFTFIDLRKTIQQIVDDCSQKMSLTSDCSKNGLCVEYKYPQFLPHIEGLYDEITYVIESIVSNALYEMTHERCQQLFTPQSLATPPHLRYNSPPPKIKEKGLQQLKLTISAEISEEGNVKLIFNDNGPGIPEHIIKRIFEPFFTTTRTGKTGLGLAIAYYIVSNTHKGKLSVTSEYGSGATFYVELPIIQSFDRFKNGMKLKSHLISTTDAHS